MPFGMPTGGALSGIRGLQRGGIGAEEEPGFLLSLALALDAPRNWAWGGTSKKRATGWDLLRKMGIRDKPGKFDPVEVLAFGLEVAGDPLTYLGGLGGLTKAGKLASSLGKSVGSRAASTAAIKTALEGAEKFNIRQLLKATKEVEKGGDLKKIMGGLVDAEGKAVKLTAGEATRFERGVTAVKRAHEAQARTKTLKTQLNELGASEILAKSWKAAAQMDLPQRKLLSLTIPFTDIEKVLIKGAPVVGAIQATGQVLGKFPPIAATGRLISNAFQRSDVLQPYMHEYKLQARQILREGVEKETALGKEADELFGLEQAHQIQATERYAQKEYGKSASELTAEEIQKRFDDTLQRSYVTEADYTKEQFFDDILTGREAYGMDPVILKRKEELGEAIVVEVEKIRGASRKKWADELYRRLVGQRTRNKERSAILKERGRSLSTLKTPAIVQIEKRLSQLQGRFSERLDNLAVSAKKDIETEVDKLLGLRKELDDAEFGLAKQKVDRDTFQSALDEAVPGYRSVLNEKGTAFSRFEKIADDAKSLEDIAESRGLSVKDLRGEAQENFRQLKKSKSNVERLKGNLSKAEGDIEAQIGRIEKKMGEDGAWSVPTDVTATITFAGYDTFGSGFTPGFLRPQVLIENDPAVIKHLKKKYGKDIKARDIVNERKALIEDIKKAKKNDPNHIFHASPECQACSPAGKGAETGLLPQDYETAEAIIDIIKGSEPPVVTIENHWNYTTRTVTKGKHKGYQPTTEIKRALEEAGYEVDIKKIQAADYGSPSTRERLILRAVKQEDLIVGGVKKSFDEVYPLPQPTGQGDWWSAIAPFMHEAKDTKFALAATKVGSKRLETDIKDLIAAGKLSEPTMEAPVIYMGRDAIERFPKGHPRAGEVKRNRGGIRNAGTPDNPQASPALLRGKASARVIFPDGQGGYYAKSLSPRQLSALMGFGDEMPMALPKGISSKAAADILGNGMAAATTRNTIQHLIEQRMAAGIVPKIGKKSKFQTAATEGQRESLKGRFRLREAELKKNLEVKRLEGEADMLRNELSTDEAILRQTADENALAAIPEFKEINANPLKGIDEALPKKVKGRLAKKLQDAVHDNDGMIQRLDENLADNDAYVSLLRPESQALVKHLDQEVGELLARRVAVGATKEGTVMAARLQSITKNYAERVLTSDARKYIAARRATDGKGGTMLDQYHRHMGRYSKSAMSAKTGGDIPRLDRWREEFTSEVNKFFEKLPGDRPAQWFNKDFSVTYPGKYIGDERSVLNATFVTSLVNGKGIVKKILEKNAHDYVTLGDFYMEHGIHRVTVKGKEIVLGDSKAARKAMKDAGLLDKGIRNSLADEIRGVTVKLVDSDDLSQLGEIYDKMVLGPLRWSLTRPWLPFHLRNFSTNIFLNWLGGVSNPKYYKMAARAVFEKDPSELKRLTDIGVLTGGWSREAARELTEPGRIDLWARMEKWFKNKYPKGSKAWKQYTSFAEDMGRAAHYYGKKADGLTDFEALESVNKYLLDYSDLTKFERRYGKRMFMFYNWTRKMIPMLTKEFISNPSKMAALTRGSVQPSLLRPEGLPSYIKQSFALPLPWKDKQGREQFITTFGSPIEEFRKFDVSQREGGLAGIGSELARTIIGQMTPPLKQAAEIAAGKDFFYRKPIQESDRVKQMFGLEKLLPGLRTDVLKSGKTRLRADPDMLYALRQSPFSRVISTLQKLGDPDRDISDKLFATLSGINVARFYKETQAPRSLVDMLKRKLKLEIPEGMVRKFETIYPTEAGKKNAEVMRMMDILRSA